MLKEKLLPVLVVIAVLSVGVTAYMGFIYNSQISIPVSGDDALETVKAEPTAERFIAENFGLPEDRIERVSLAWDAEEDTYVWEIEIQERACGCMLNDTENGVTILRAVVDPITGELGNLTTRVGVPEAQIQREACEKGCHS